MTESGQIQRQGVFQHDEQPFPNGSGICRVQEPVDGRTGETHFGGHGGIDIRIPG
jgi:hypothetical protein